MCVTGASGFVGSHCIKLALERGYRVRGTVRNLKAEEKIKHLKEKFPSCQLFEADLLKEGSFDKCFKNAT